MPMVNQANLNDETKKVNKVNLRIRLPEIKTNIPNTDILRKTSQVKNMM